MTEPADTEELPTALSADRKDRGGIQSLERAFAILEQIADHPQGISLGELSRRVQLHTSTTFHLLKTMASLGYVQQFKDSKKYRIGRRLFALAAGAMDELELLRIATPVLEQLSAATSEAGHFAVMSGDAVVVVARSSGPGIFQMVARGGPRPAHCTAIGKVLLAALPDARLNNYLASHELQPFTAKTICDPDRLRQEISEVRRQWIAFDDGEFDPEVRCVAAAVCDFSGQVVGAIGISGPVWRLSLSTLHQTAEQVRHAAAMLSGEFGSPDESRRTVTESGDCRELARHGRRR